MNELAHTCDRLSTENAELRDQVSRLSAGTALAGPGGRRQLPFEAAVSRRTVGKALGVAAAGVVGAAAFADLARPAAHADRRAGPVREDAAAGPAAELLSDDEASAPSVIDVSVASSGAVLVAANTGSGVGGAFAGPAGQIQLTPGKSASHPASGTQGSLYADKGGRLWFCTKSGTRATWKEVKLS